MKRITKTTALALFISALALIAVLVHAEERSFSGEIMDSQCVSMGGHEQMYNDEVRTPKDCTLQCVKYDGGKFELYNLATQKVYELDDQKKAEEFAGEKVIVTGTYDESTETIHVTKMEAAK